MFVSRSPDPCKKSTNAQRSAALSFAGIYYKPPSSPEISQTIQYPPTSSVCANKGGIFTQEIERSNWFTSKVSRRH